MNRAKQFLGALLILNLAFVGSVAADDSKSVTYAADIAPILFTHCAECHRPGQIGPMSLLSYEETRPWAKSIKNTVVSREMPPWDADPAHGSWANDISLSDEEIKIVSAWVDQGAPMGDAAALPATPSFPEGWTIGEPDMIIDLPEVTVPADGEDLFPDHVMTFDLPPGAWLSAVEILPGNREVLHHVVAFLGEAAMRANADGEAAPPGVRGGDVAIASIWAAGTPPTVNPAGMGHPLRPKQTFTFNMHYHPSGRESVDRTRVGLHFGEGELKKRMKTTAALNAGFLIPPGQAAYEARGLFRFSEDSTIISLFPHMHLRGKNFEYILHRPDGSSETLLKVPSYDFEWQWVYYPKNPITIPAGSHIEIVGRWDNSAANPNNPNPSARIGFGEETDDEMLIGFMDVVPVTGVEFAQEKPAEVMTNFLGDIKAENAYLVTFGAMMPSSIGFHLPKSGDGAMYLWASASLASLPVSELKWSGEEVSGKVVIFGVELDMKGVPAEDGVMNFALTAREVKSDSPQVKFLVRMLSNLKGTRLKPATEISSAN